MRVRHDGAAEGVGDDHHDPRARRYHARVSAHERVCSREYVAPADFWQKPMMAVRAGSPEMFLNALLPSGKVAERLRSSSASSDASNLAITPTPESGGQESVEQGLNSERGTCTHKILYLFFHSVEIYLPT